MSNSDEKMISCEEDERQEEPEEAEQYNENDEGESMDDGELRSSDELEIDEETAPADDSLAKIQAHNKDIFYLAVSPNGDWLASGSEDDTASIWNTKSLSTEPISRIDQHVDSVHCLAWNTSSNILASGDMAGRIVCTQVQSLTIAPSYLIIEDCQKNDIEEHDFEQLRWLIWHHSADGVMFSGTGDGSIWMWLITRQKTNQTLSINQSKIFTTGTNAPCVSSKLLTNSKHILAAYEDGIAKLWDLKETSSGIEIKLPGQCTSAMDLNAKAALAAIGFTNGMVALIGIGGTGDTLKLVHMFNSKLEQGGSSEDKEDDNNSIESVVFSPDNFPWLAIGTTNGRLSIFDWERRSNRYECDHDGEAIVNCIWQMGPNNSIYLISACIDGGLRIWDSKSGHPLMLLSGGSDEIFTLARLENEQGILLFTGCAGGLIRIFKFPDINI